MKDGDIFCGTCMKVIKKEEINIYEDGREHHASCNAVIYNVIESEIGFELKE